MLSLKQKQCPSWVGLGSYKSIIKTIKQYILAIVNSRNLFCYQVSCVFYGTLYTWPHHVQFTSSQVINFLFSKQRIRYLSIFFFFNTMIGFGVGRGQAPLSAMKQVCVCSLYILHFVLCLHTQLFFQGEGRGYSDFWGKVLEPFGLHQTIFATCNFSSPFIHLSLIHFPHK